MLAKRQGFCACAIALLLAGCSSNGTGASAATVACQASLGHDSKSVALMMAKGATGSVSIAAYTVRFSIVAVPIADGTGWMRAKVSGPKLGNNDGQEAGFSSSQPRFGGSFPTSKGLFAYGCGG
jgi:hypothetical protein